MKRKVGGKNVFVIHGHDKAALGELCKIIEESDFIPILLKEQPMKGATTLIEKFEGLAPQCNFAIALMSPDDKSFDALKHKGESERFQARQNVLIELGWFMAHLGRERVYIVVKGDVDMPSDILGVEVFRCRRRVSETASQIRDVLKATRAVRS